MTLASPTSRFGMARYRWMNIGVIVGSVLLCLLMLPARLPGMELLGVTPSWLLVWIVTWSLKRSPWEGAIAGFTLGLLQDAMTSHYPTHTLGFMLVGFLTARIQKQRFIQEDFVSVALIVFGMVVLAQTSMACQVTLHKLLESQSLYPALTDIWKQHQRIVLSSAILSSLWAPILYYPLNRWWTYFERKTAPPGN
ncbi:MAG: rod shape-determining protein MreD [Cyanobacteria bacterium]|nr:rod shape-determining protein MreD [Cyanobacteriota bacterium]MDA0864963.1 rod shape-determining protein MreD [Cyanobacteriota bacterium]